MASNVLLVPMDLNSSENRKVYELAQNGIKLADGSTVKGRFQLVFHIDDAVDMARAGLKTIHVMYPQRVGVDESWTSKAYPDLKIEYIEVNKPSVGFHFTHAPLPVMRITQKFGERKDFYAQWYGPNVGHLGLDYGAAKGTPVFAVADGVVSTAYSASRENRAGGGHNFGYHVKITHRDGYTTIYAHFDTVGVKVGDRVNGGQKIGTVNSTGNSSGHHLHFAMKKEGSTHHPYNMIDPTPFLNGVKEPAPVAPTGSVVDGFLWSNNVRIHRASGLATITGNSNLREKSNKQSRLIGTVRAGSVVIVRNPNKIGGYVAVKAPVKSMDKYKPASATRRVASIVRPKMSNRAEIVDVSRWRLNVPPRQLKAQGVDGVYVKAGQVRKTSETSFDKEVDTFRRSGLLIGAYWYADKRSDPVMAARKFMEQIGKFKWTLPPAVDIEDQAAGPMPDVWWFDSFFGEMRRFWTSDIVIYTSARYFNKLTTTKTWGCLLWLAAYTDREPLVLPRAFAGSNKNWLIWQNTDKYKVVGYGPGIDHNFYNGTDADLARCSASFASTGKWHAKLNTQPRGNQAPKEWTDPKKKVEERSGKWKETPASIAWRNQQAAKGKAGAHDPKAKVAARKEAKALSDDTTIYSGPPVPFYYGLHDRSNRHAQQRDYEMARIGGFNAVKLQSGATVGSYNRYKQAGIRFAVCRLYGSFEGRRISAVQFVREAMPDFDRLYGSGVRYVELHNEPNLTSEGLKSSWQSGEDFGRWTIEVCAELKKHYPAIRCGLAALSPGHSTDYNVNGKTGSRVGDTEFFNGIVSVGTMEHVDWIAMHCYYNGEAEIQREVERVRVMRERYPSKPIGITETSNPIPAVDHAEKGKQVKQFMKNVSGLGGILGAFAFLVSGDGWDSEVMRRENGSSTGFAESFAAS